MIPHRPPPLPRLRLEPDFDAVVDPQIMDAVIASREVSYRRSEMLKRKTYANAASFAKAVRDQDVLVEKNRRRLKIVWRNPSKN